MVSYEFSRKNVIHAVTQSVDDLLSTNNASDLRKNNTLQEMTLIRFVGNRDDTGTSYFLGRVQPNCVSVSQLGIVAARRSHDRRDANLLLSPAEFRSPPIESGVDSCDFV